LQARANKLIVNNNSLSNNDVVAEGRSNNLPGPGSYEQHDVIGPQRPTKLDARVFTPNQHSVPKAQNRF
jgi:hypothetical protein